MTNVAAILLSGFVECSNCLQVENDIIMFCETDCRLLHDREWRLPELNGTVFDHDEPRSSNLISQPKP